MRLFLCLAAVLLVHVDAWAFDLSVTPGVVDVNLAPGSVRSFAIQVTNNEARPITLDVYAWDMWYAPDEWTAFLPPGTHERSAATWMTPVPADVVVQPRETTQLKIAINTPADAHGGYYGIVFIQGRTGDGGHEGLSIEQTGRVGVQFFSQVGAIDPELSVRSTEVARQDGHGPWALSFDVENTGDVHLIPGFRGILKRESDGAVVATPTSRVTRPYLPGQHYPLPVPPFGPLEAGRYDLVGTIEAGMLALRVSDVLEVDADGEMRLVPDAPGTPADPPPTPP